MLRALFLASITTVLAPAAAVGSPLLNTFGPGDAVDSSSPYSLSGGIAAQQAVQFTPSASGTVESVQAALRAVSGTGVSSLRITICPDVGGQPGPTPIWTSQVQVVSSTQPPQIYTFPGTDVVTLVACQTYWLVIEGTLTTGNAAAAHPGLPATLGIRASKTSSTPWAVVSGSPLPAVRINASASGACCNPATGGCSVITSIACAALGLNFTADVGCVPGSCNACPADINRSGGVSVQDIFDFLELYFAGCP